MLLATSVFAQNLQKGNTQANLPTRISVAGNAIGGSDIVVHKGTAYVSLPALARAAGAHMIMQGGTAVLELPSAGENACGDVEGRLSDTYRKAAVRIPDAIERLRMQASQKGAVVPAASFDAVDRQIAEAALHAQTEADRSVSYALSHANNTVAIMYYKLFAGVAPEEARQGQLDSLLCSAESKFALELGRLSGGESCSVFHSDAGNGEEENTSR